MDIIALGVAVGLVVFVVGVTVLVGRKWPEAATYLFLFLPLITLALLIYLFSRPELVQQLNLDSAVLPQLLSTSSGAVLGLIGAGIITLFEKAWAEKQRKVDFDWSLRISLMQRLSSYPYDPASCGKVQIDEIKNILMHAAREVVDALNSHVIPESSQYSDYVCRMRNYYKQSPNWQD